MILAIIDIVKIATIAGTIVGAIILIVGLWIVTGTIFEAFRTNKKGR